MDELLFAHAILISQMSGERSAMGLFPGSQIESTHKMNSFQLGAVYYCLSSQRIQLKFTSQGRRPSNFWSMQLQRGQKWQSKVSQGSWPKLDKKLLETLACGPKGHCELSRSWTAFKLKLTSCRRILTCELSSEMCAHYTKTRRSQSQRPTRNGKETAADDKKGQKKTRQQVLAITKCRQAKPGQRKVSSKHLTKQTPEHGCILHWKMCVVPNERTIAYIPSCVSPITNHFIKLNIPRMAFGWF